MYIFNPDNDLALANFTSNYTPPASAVKLAGDLELLPVWFAPENSRIVVNYLESLDYFELVKDALRLKGKLIRFEEIKNFRQRIIPWGWNPMLRRRLLDAGVLEETLPALEQLELLRDYSNRKHAVRMLEALKSKGQDFCGESSFFTSVDEVIDYLASFPGDKALKMPLSGSGRGVIWIKGAITDKQADWCRRVIGQQGGVVAEPYLSRVQDFAMEFSMVEGEVEFIGYSLFETAASGAYMGNLLMRDEDIENELSRYLPARVIHLLKEMLLELLPDYFPKYGGYLGVDMMVCKTDDGYRIQPCVEINMRMNMGIVAHQFYHRFVKQDRKGFYKVEFFKKNPEALLFHQKMQIEFPLVVENARILSGYLALTPVSEQTSYIAYVLIKESGSVEY